MLIVTALLLACLRHLKCVEKRLCRKKVKGGVNRILDKG
jgi:hypothetical protein